MSQIRHNAFGDHLCSTKSVPSLSTILNEKQLVPILFKMRSTYARFALVLSSIFLVASCGQGSSSENTTETSPVSIVYGEGCNKTNIQTSRNLFNDYLTLRSALPETGTPSRSQINDITVALKNYRSFVRNLDLPTLQVEQTAIVDETEKYINTLNKYVSSNFMDLSVNDQMIPFSDAQTDFDGVFSETCYYDR